MFEVFRSRKMAVLLLLGFSSGLPLYLTSRTLQAWMTVDKVDISTIGFFSLVALPYSLKFLWSPILDRYTFPFRGRRTGWLLITQVALALALAAMSFANPAQNLRFFAATALMIAFLSATQDITVDAYSVDVAETHEVGALAGIKVLGYRIAMIVTGSVAFILADRLGWPTVYLLLSGLMIITLLLSFSAAEPSRRVQAKPMTLSQAVRTPILEFFHRLGGRKAACILVFILLYRLADSMISNMAAPFLLQTGFSLTDVGAIQSGVGLIATIGGVLIGGAFLSRIGINKSLWIFGSLQAASNLGYFLLAEVGKSYPLMVGAILVEHLCAGLTIAALVGFLMSLCNPGFSATQYALLSSLEAAGRNIVTAPVGVLAKSTGWSMFFLISCAAALPGLMLLPSFAPWNNRDDAENRMN